MSQDRPTSNLETSLLRGTEVRELRAEVERLQRLTARMLPYIQEFEPGDAFEIEAQTNLVAEAQKALAGLPVETTAQPLYPQIILDRLRQIANLIDSRPVMGHWPAMMTQPDADFLRSLADALKERKTHPLLAESSEETSEHRDYAAVRDAHDRTVQELDRYKQALTRANGFLIMHGHEPVKLEYSQTSQEGLASAGSSAAVNPRDAVGGSAEPSGRPAAPRHLTPPERDALTRAADGSVTEIDAGYEDDREAIAPGDYHYYKPSGRVDQPEKASVNPYCLQDGVPCASDGRGGCLACVDEKGTLNGKGDGI